jgi:hypothetical protein
MKTIPEFQLAEVIGHFRFDTELFGISFPNKDYTVWLYPDRIIVIENGKNNPEEFRGMVNLKPQLEYAKKLRKAGFERTRVFSPSHFVEYAFILQDEQERKIFFMDEWRECTLDLKPPEFKATYMELMRSTHKGCLTLANGSVQYLD